MRELTRDGRGRCRLSMGEVSDALSFLSRFFLWRCVLRRGSAKSFSNRILERGRRQDDGLAVASGRIRRSSVCATHDVGPTPAAVS